MALLLAEEYTKIIENHDRGGVVQRFRIPQVHLKWPAIKISEGTCLAPFEVLLIAIWAIWIGRGMLEYDVERIPPGTEFPVGNSDQYYLAH